MKLADNKATLSFSNGSPSIEMPVYSGNIGPDVIDIRKLYAQSGMFTYDPGFLSTASCQSAITYIDGDKGELLYRGYPIEQLANKADYLDTCYLLLNGELPVGQQSKDFHKLVNQHTMVNEQMQFFLRGFRRDAHPMAVLTGLVGALSAFYHDSTDINNPEHRHIAAIRLIAKMPTLVAMAYKYGVGQPFMYPRNDLSYAGNFLRMMFGTPCEEYKVNPVLERAMDRIFTLHADHEQNASTSTVRLCGSSGTNPFAAIAAAISARGASAADPLGIALVLPSPLGDVGWSHTLVAGLDPVIAAYGDAVKITLLENIAEGPDADRIMNKAVADGNKFLIAGSFGYQNGAMQIAKRDPSVTVLSVGQMETVPEGRPPHDLWIVTDGVKDRGDPCEGFGSTEG